MQQRSTAAAAAAAAASAAVPLEYFQCVYSHTTHSAATAAIPEQPIRGLAC